MWDKFKTWAARPFSVDMSAAEWFAFFGLLIVIAALWNVILLHLARTIRGAE